MLSLPPLGAEPVVVARLGELPSPGHPLVGPVSCDDVIPPAVPYSDAPLCLRLQSQFIGHGNECQYRVVVLGGDGLE